jgi:hypothetical protein
MKNLIKTVALLSLLGCSSATFAGEIVTAGGQHIETPTKPVANVGSRAGDATLHTSTQARVSGSTITTNRGNAQSVPNAAAASESEPKP